MRLLHVFPTFSPGGTELRMASLMNELGAEFEHTIIPLNDRREAASRLQPDTRARFISPPPGRGAVGFPLALRRIVATERPDVLVTYNWGAIDAIIGARFPPLCPIVHNECGFGPDEADGLKWRRVLTRRVLLNRIHKTIVVSESLEKLALGEFGLRPERVRFIRTGVDTSQFRPRPGGELREKWGIAPGELVFGFVGGLRPEKRLDRLISAFDMAGLTGRAKLVLVGAGPLDAELRELVARRGLVGAVIFAGRAEQPAGAYNAMDVFVMSSSTEGTPNALLEAMASGLPVLCTEVGGCVGALGREGAPFTVPWEDADGYVLSLQRLAADAELRAEAGRINRERAEREFPRERMIREYAEVYRAAAAA